MQNQQQPQQQARPTAAFILSLLAGFWMLSMGGIGMGGMMSGTDWGLGGGGHMRGMSHHQMWGYGLVNNVWWPWVGVLAGIAVLLGAVMLYTKPSQTRGWGILILVASGVNLLVGMGGLLASVLGIIGGALALSWKTPV